MRNWEVMSREQVFDKLAAEGFNKVEVEFSGGGDEGGVDNIAFYKDDCLDSEMDGYGADDDPLGSALAQPVYDRYGGFGFEGGVSGTLIWDIDSRRLSINGNKQHYLEFSEDL